MTKRSYSFSPNGGLRILFQGLTYTVPSSKNRGERVTLLSDVCGWFEPYQMAALMGPSGSGKTTLLDVLAGRKTQGKLDGLLQFGGKEPSRDFLCRYTGYVEQFDTLIGILTVEEMLMYTAELKRSHKETLESKKKAVDKLIGKLALERCRNVKIGTKLQRGISGGQAKRANIGIALIGNPRVLFLDEPTSGLDSYTANEVMTVVKQLVQDGTTICATIHSPSQFTFGLFDRLLMLVRGQVVYFGLAEDAANYALESSRQVKERSNGLNDAEYLVDLITEADHLGQGGELAKKYEESTLHQNNTATLAQYIASKEDVDEKIAQELATKTATMIPWWHAVWVLMKYRTRRNYTSGQFLGLRIGDKILVGLIVMTLYWATCGDFSDENLINICAILFIWNVLPGFGAFGYVPEIFMERTLYAREKADGLYHAGTYLVAKMIDEILILAVATLAISAWTFWAVRFQGEFVLFWIVYWIGSCVGVAIAYLVACIAPTMEAANALLPVYIITLMFTQGFLIRYKDMPPWWSWYQYINFLKYSYGAIVVNQFSGDQGNPIWYQNGGETVLEYYSLDAVDKWAYVGYLSLFFLFYFLMAWTVLAFKNFRSR